LLEVRDLTAGYGDIIGVAGLSLRVGAGEVVAILGANGAGKTTSLSAIFGLVRPRHGDVCFDGTVTTGFSPRRMGRLGCSLVPEGRGLFPSMTVEEHLRLGAFLQSGADWASTVDEIFHYFPRLLERRKQVAGTLSGGEQQMLALGRALMAQPRLLMVDELSLGLAPIVIGQLYAELTRVVRERGSALLVVEQHAAMALRYADRVYVLEAGTLRLEGTADELRAGDALQKAYLGIGVGDGVRSDTVGDAPPPAERELDSLPLLSGSRPRFRPDRWEGNPGGSRTRRVYS
jgi:branched-chain amino acid transport system ATP-binding protein